MLVVTPDCGAAAVSHRCHPRSSCSAGPAERGDGLCARFAADPFAGNVAVPRGGVTSGGLMARDLVGERLRSYWREYDGVTRVRANFTRDLFRGLSLVLAGDNLLGQQRGEPDNATIVLGRTITAGIKAKF